MQHSISSAAGARLRLSKVISVTEYALDVTEGQRKGQAESIAFNFGQGRKELSPRSFG